MSRHWAVLIGINQYQFRQPLLCAHNDAQSMYGFLTEAAETASSNCVLLSDRAPTIGEAATYPTAATLKTWLEGLDRAGVQAEDSLWIFFSGYGECINGQDYLLPIDAAVECSPKTWFSIRSLYAMLSQLPTQHILVVLDMSRSQSARSDGLLGRQTMQNAKELGIATILSCQPEQFSHESVSLGHGLFTAALLEGLRTQAGQPLIKLVRFLQVRLPELSEHHYRPRQDPVIMIAPAYLEQWTLPQLAKLKAIDTAIPSHPAAGTIRHPTAHRVTPLPSASTPSSNHRSSAATPAISLDEVSQPNVSTATAPTSPPTNSDITNDDRQSRKVLLQIVLLGVLLIGVLGLARYLWRGPEQPSLLVVGKSDKPTSPEPSLNPVDPAGSSHNQSSSEITDSTKILEAARALIRPRNASEVQRAIAQVSQIPPTAPNYAEAQRQIDRWCVDIIDIAQERAQQGNLQGAIAAAKLVPSNQGKYTQQAQQLITQWQTSQR